MCASVTAFCPPIAGLPRLAQVFCGVLVPRIVTVPVSVPGLERGLIIGPTVPTIVHEPADREPCRSRIAVFTFRQRPGTKPRRDREKRFMRVPGVTVLSLLPQGYAKRECRIKRCADVLNSQRLLSRFGEGFGFKPARNVAR